MEKKLNLGSAGRKKDGFINVDWLSLVKPDVEHNLNVFPYPFQDNEFDLVEATHIIEHLDRPFLVMKEIQRITKPGGTVVIKVPHFSRAMGHPEHFHGFDVSFPYYFNKTFIELGYFGVDFDLKKMKLNWFAFSHIAEKMGFGSLSIIFLKTLNKIINFFANLSPVFLQQGLVFLGRGF